MQKFASINFAQDRNKSFLDRFLIWTLSTGRVIIVLTEAIALCAFLYRFSLDKQIIDLHGHIKDGQAIVIALNANNNNETTFRNLQTRLSAIQTLAPQALSRTQLLEHLYTQKPSDMTIEQADLTNSVFSLQAFTTNEKSIESFLSTLKADSLMSEILLTKVENKTSSGTIVIGITGKIN